MSWQQRIDRALDERRAAEAFRRRLPVTHGAGRWLEREGERWLNFSSNDYLGLSQHPAIIAAWQQGATRYGVGAGGSGHVSGYSEAHRALEEALADWLGYPRALLFISGFAANQALIAALQNGEIHAAGLDVFEHEPLAKDSPLLSLPNVVALPHIGSATHETRYNMAACAVDNLIDALNGNVEKNCVNPQVK